MIRIALVSSESIRARMGGIGIRYLEIARQLRESGFEVRVISPAAPDETRAAGLVGCEIEQFRPGAVAEHLEGCGAVVAQGQLANDVAMADPSIPVAIDLYDPWMIENLHYVPQLGYGPYRNDHASWVLQMSRGDVFLCASREQRLFYLGFLAALGRVNPRRLDEDPRLERLLLEVPFGCPPPGRPRGGLLPERRPGERRILFGGVYDWYDVDTFVAALDRLGEIDWSAWVVRHPSPESTPQEKFARLEREAVRRGWWGGRVRTIEWIPAARRSDLFADVDLLVGPHLPGLEGELAFRTRFLDALAAGCPAVATEGGTLSRLLSERRAGWVVASGSGESLSQAIRAVLEGGDEVAERVEHGRELAAEFQWQRVLAPLAEFLRAPRVDASRREFVHRLETRTADEPRMARLRRRLRRTRRN